MIAIVRPDSWNFPLFIHVFGAMVLTGGLLGSALALLSSRGSRFLPGLGFRPVLGQRGMANFVSFEPGTEAPRHVHEEEQIVIVIDGEFTFDLDGDVRTMRRGDVAVVPSWVPHGAWTTDSPCLEIDVFVPPRESLLKLAEAQSAAVAAAAEQESGARPDGA